MSGDSNDRGAPDLPETSSVPDASGAPGAPTSQEQSSGAGESARLERQLRRIAPDVDLDVARAAMRARRARSRRRRRRAYGGAVAAACAAVLVGALTLVQRGADPHGPPTEATTDTDTDQEPPDQSDRPEPRVTSVEIDGIEVEVTAPDRAVAGTRLWFEVVVRNVGGSPVPWDAGGCAIPVMAVAGPASSVAFVRHDLLLVYWSGEVEGLGGFVAEANALPTTQSHQPEAYTGVRDLACTLEISPALLSPGEELRHRGSVELRVPPGPLPDGGDYRLLVEFAPLAGPAESSAGGQWPAPVTVEVPLTVEDHPGRTADGADAAAMAAFAADSRLAPWMGSTAVPGQPDLVQSYLTELSWWRGAWELWLSARWEGHELRMRYDPVAGEVVDVRADVSGAGHVGGAPDDEYGDHAPTGDLPDRILLEARRIAG